MAVLTQKFLAISPEEVSFRRRGFPGAGKPAQEHLEGVARAFVRGYTAALEESELPLLAQRCQAEPPGVQGFAFEGSAMALALQDFLAPWRRSRLLQLLDGPGAVHTYLVHVGVGWALARFPIPPGLVLGRLDPLLRWLAWDGFGFHQGFFHHRQALAGSARPRRVRGYGLRAFDQGLGRSLWFVYGADVEEIAAGIGAFPPSRRSDLWSGVGLACAFAGGCDPGTVERLRVMARDHLPFVAQGAAFAAKARSRPAQLIPATELACETLCGSTAEEAAAVTDEALEGLPADDPDPAFEVWRRRIAERYSSAGEETRVGVSSRLAEMLSS